MEERKYPEGILGKDAEMKTKKFIAFNTEYKDFSESAMLGNYDDLYVDDLNKIVNESDYHIILEFTGGYDINKKEIYEGHIVKCLGDIYVIRWSEEQFRWLFYPYTSEKHYPLNKYTECEIIGHELTHPELLPGINKIYSEIQVGDEAFLVNLQKPCEVITKTMYSGEHLVVAMFEDEDKNGRTTEETIRFNKTLYGIDVSKALGKHLCLMFSVGELIENLSYKK